MSRFLGLFLVIFAGVSPVAGAADSTPLERKISVFNEVFSDSPTSGFYYHELMCTSNIMAFYRVLQTDKDLPLENDKVVIIYEKNRDSFLVSNARVTEKLPVPLPFTLHVIYVSGGHVFDFDYGQEPQVVDIKTYLAKQFDPQRAKFKHLLARVYSAANYAEAYRGPHGNRYILDIHNLSENLVDLDQLAESLTE